MALNTITSPIGIDARVKALQTDLFNELIALWGVTSDKYDSYPICHKNYNKGRDGYIPEYLESGAKDYTEVLHNDKTGITSFFGIDDNGIEHDGVNHETVSMHIVFMGDLSVIKNATPPAVRSDIDVRRDVYNILKRDMYGFELQEEVTGIDNVLSEYTGVLSDEQHPYMDMRPNHCFRFNLICRYNPKTVVNFNT